MFTIKTYGGKVLGHEQNMSLALSYADMQCAILHKQVYVYNESKLIAIYHPAEFGVKQHIEDR